MSKNPQNISQIQHLQTSGEVGFGIVTYRPGGRIWPRLQSHYQLVVIHRGEMRVDIDRQTHHCSEGEGILLGPEHEEQFFFSKTEDTVHSWCQAPPEEFPPSLRFSPNQVSHPAPCSAWLRSFMRANLKISSPTSRTPEMQNSVLAAVISAMWNFCSGIPKADNATPPLPPPLHSVWLAIEGHLAETHTLESLARIARVSKNHLITLSKEHWGITPAEYLWQLRLEEASRLLRETGLSVSEIAYRTGFSNPFHFSRRFRQRFQKNPRLWRDEEWGRNQEVFE